MKRWLARAGLSLATLTLCLLLIEGVLRLGAGGDADFVADAVVAEHPPALYTADGQRTRLQPNTEVTFRAAEYTVPVRTNSLGLRGPEAAPGGLLCLGDSFTFGAQVPEELTWCSRMGGANAGVGGYGTFEATLALNELRPELQPSQVVLAFYLGNDLRDNRNHERPPPPTSQAPVSPLGEGLSALSRRLGQASYTWSALAAAWTLHNPDFRVEEYADEMRPFLGLSEELRGPTARAFAELERSCRDLDCRVVLIPPLYVVEADRREATFRAFDMAPPEDIDALAREVTALTRLPVLDLTPALRAAEGPLYYRFDPHWNAEGHRVAAEAITAWEP